MNIKRRNIKRRNRREKQLNKIMKEMIYFDIDRGAFKFDTATVNLRISGGYALVNLKDRDILEYLFMTIGELDKVIPIDYKSEIEENMIEGFNRCFHNNIANIKSIYKSKAEKELNEKVSKKSLFYGVLTLIMGILFGILGLF